MDIFRSMATFVAFILFVSFNVGLAVDEKALLLHTGIAPDGWSRVCRYYTPIRIVSVKQPISLNCPMFGRI